MSKQKCKLCSCEGVDSTLLCRDHLDGYKYACGFLPDKTVVQLFRLIVKVDDNGESK